VPSPGTASVELSTVNVAAPTGTAKKTAAAHATKPTSNVVTAPSCADSL
jgi:hypothetical protein